MHHVFVKLDLQIHVTIDEQKKKSRVGGQNKIGFGLMKHTPIATESSHPSNPPGFTPSGVLIHGIISQHAV